jgi:hypothetical protein
MGGRKARFITWRAGGRVAVRGACAAAWTAAAHRSVSGPGQTIQKEGRRGFSTHYSNWAGPMGQVRIDTAWGDPHQPQQAEELVALAPDVIVSTGS